MDQLGPLFDQRVTTLVDPAGDVAGNGEDLPILFECVARGDERTTARRDLDQDNAEAEAADDAIAPWESRFVWQHAHRKFRDHAPSCCATGDLAKQVAVLSGVNCVETTSQYSDRQTSHIERTGVCCRVDTPCEPADNTDATGGQLGRQIAGNPTPVVGGPARSDNGDAGRAPWRSTQGEQNRRSIDGLAQGLRVLRIRYADGATADAGKALQLIADPGVVQNH